MQQNRLMQDTALIVSAAAVIPQRISRVIYSLFCSCFKGGFFYPPKNGLVIGLLYVYGAIIRKEYSGFIFAWALFLFAVFAYAHE